jgi:probable rRNA maturation factor
VSVEVAREANCRELTDRDIESAASAALEYGGRPEFALTVVLVDDPTLAELHSRCLNDPSVTDVMSFDLSDEVSGPVGEVYVSVDRAREVAKRREVTVSRELTLYVVHGTLHLCGFDDIDDEDRLAMRRAESVVMERLGHHPDPLPHDE